jgi:hypothetical protein
MPNNMKRASLTVWALVLLFVTVSCLFSSQADEDQDATRQSIQVQQTLLSRDQAALTQAASAAQQGTHTPDPEIIELPQQQPTSTQTPISPAEPTLTPAPLINELDERTLKSARILLFEDMSASGQIRLVKDALDQAGYFYLDVGSAKGWFKTQLTTGQEWDLIIAAAEANRNFGGELFQLIDEHIRNGASAIIEYRDLDASPAGKSKPLLDHCGVQFQSDWFEPDLRVFFVLQPDHPIFHQPNQVFQFSNAPQMWKGDVGDLVEIKYKDNGPSGDAQLLLGTSARWKNHHGLLVNCMDGRLTFQLFASHEYQYGDIVPLWQNYIYQALKARFSVAPPPAPTPAVTVLPSPTPDPPPTTDPARPPNEPLGTYSCGGLIDARLIRMPQYQDDLFEHHAAGTFMVLRVELLNQSGYPLQIWDDDYRLHGRVFNREVDYAVDEAATGYLYIEGGGKLYQDRIEPGVPWRTKLAFDIDPRGEDWTLVIRPGSKFDEQVCEVKIPIP